MSEKSEMIVWMDSNNIANNKKVVVGINDEYLECVMNVTNATVGKLLKIHRCNNSKKKDRIVTLLLPPSFQIGESVVGNFTLLDKDNNIENANLSYKYSHSGVVINIRNNKSEQKNNVEKVEEKNNNDKEVITVSEIKEIFREINAERGIGKQLELLVEEKKKNSKSRTKSCKPRKKFPYNKYQIMVMPKGFSEKFSKYIRENGMTRKEVAEKFDVSQRTIGRIVNKEIGYINKKLYKEINKKLSVKN